MWDSNYLSLPKKFRKNSTNQSTNNESKTYAKSPIGLVRNIYAIFLFKFIKQLFKRISFMPTDIVYS